ncbi:RNA polymerase sigma factor [Ulvibacter litoralis]|uniref:RNA polymerase sigma-70 factor, ECF subfamily n=1 Tax=Ulvibacter litoralis TaxID=227084 RepID=A0A1G7GDY5_9FLAO|nr:RNA polymerase sigma factor [Ulvibacter litoralis]GHC56632.1 DNA-directed RNA polymerase sigma-70 factor [Ulvibacter litoralis]SDE86229.1 RNA polymerase sigma-70 factor, ECF subfamily [Ulvibacter litoralis]
MKLISLHKNYTSLIAKAGKGNRKAQQELFELFSPKMLSVCRQYVKNNDVAEEVMLTGFLKVFTYLKSYKGEGSFEGWIRRIMVNESITQLRKDKKLFFKDETEIENSIAHVTYIESKFEVEEIQKMIDTLPDGYKTVFVLYAVEGYKHSEIAELLQISESTSKSQLFKARKVLQAMVTKQNNRNYGTH